MKKRSFFLVLSLLALVSSSLACNLPTAATATPSPTSQVIVVTATPQPVIQTATASLAPTATTPPSTATLQPSATPIPCNQVSFVSDVSVPDGTVFGTGKPFTKTWRLKNMGSCTWTSGYQLVFVNGDQMGGPAAQSLTSVAIAPGATVDISVNLVAPASAGIYRGYWKIREPGGATFGLSTGSFWVEIKAEAPPTETPTPQPEVKMPDLFVSEFTINPSTPIKGQPAHVRIGVYNQGNAVASQFTVVWYGLSTFANPSCSWDVNDTIPANGGRILECDFTFQSGYALTLTSLAIVDSTNHVAESNEGNNQSTISPFGVKSNP